MLAKPTLPSSAINIHFITAKTWTIINSILWITKWEAMRWDEILLGNENISTCSGKGRCSTSTTGFWMLWYSSVRRCVLVIYHLKSKRTSWTKETSRLWNQHLCFHLHACNSVFFAWNRNYLFELNWSFDDCHIKCKTWLHAYEKWWRNIAKKLIVTDTFTKEVRRAEYRRFECTWTEDGRMLNGCKLLIVSQCSTKKEQVCQQKWTLSKQWECWAAEKSSGTSDSLTR